MFSFSLNWKYFKISSDFFFDSCVQGSFLCIWISNFSLTVYWKTIFFIEFPYHHSWKSVGHISENIFVNSLVCFIVLFICLNANTMLPLLIHLYSIIKASNTIYLYLSIISNLIIMFSKLALFWDELHFKAVLNLYKFWKDSFSIYSTLSFFYY